MSDDTFTRQGITWRRRWVGDNAGRYMWTSDCGRLTAWLFRGVYRYAVDGQERPERLRTLREAMDTAARRLNRISEVAA